MTRRDAGFTFAVLLSAAASTSQQPVVVSGRVFDQAGAPVAGVPVGTTNPAAALGQTGADGSFRLATSRVHDTMLVVGGRGFARMVVAIPDDGEFGDLTTERAGQLTGWVRDAAAAAPRAARVAYGSGAPAHAPR